jgi:hypothetical protein
MKWMSGSTKRQCDRSLARPRPPAARAATPRRAAASSARGSACAGWASRLIFGGLAALPQECMGQLGLWVCPAVGVGGVGLRRGCRTRNRMGDATDRVGIQGMSHQRSSSLAVLPQECMDQLGVWVLGVVVGGAGGGWGGRGCHTVPAPPCRGAGRRRPQGRGPRVRKKVSRV